MVILLTDGAENVEGMNINYHDAALLAQAMGVKVYTVAVGKDDEVPMPVDHPIFGTRYVWYRAELKVKNYTRYETLYQWLVVPALILVLLELVLANTAFRTLP